MRFLTISDTDSSSPADSLLSRSSRKTLIYLVLTLYHLYPDYDISAVNVHQFFAESQRIAGTILSRFFITIWSKHQRN